MTIIIFDELNSIYQEEVGIATKELAESIVLGSPLHEAVDRVNTDGKAAITVTEEPVKVAVVGTKSISLLMLQHALEQEVTNLCTDSYMNACLDAPTTDDGYEEPIEDWKGRGKRKMRKPR